MTQYSDAVGLPCHLDVLDHVYSLTHDGNYAEADRILDCVRNHPNFDHKTYKGARINCCTARTKLHLQDDLAARCALNNVPSFLSASNPLIDSDIRTINGILLKREAHRAWKSGNILDALNKARDAITEFRNAETSAADADKEGNRLKFCARLNLLHCEGLEGAMLGKTADHFRTLTVGAVIAEGNSRDWSPPKAADNLTGLVIIADLAIGAKLGLSHMDELSDDPNYHTAYQMIFNQHDVSATRCWPAFLLQQVNNNHHLCQDTLARTILLGAKILFDDEYHHDNELLSRYAYKLCNLFDAFGSNGSNPKIRKQLQQMRSRLPFYMIERYEEEEI
jgi:hypothetical protein